MRIRKLKLMLLWSAIAPFWCGAAERGESVAVVYNSRMTESREVAEHYAAKRRVPKEQVFGFELPTTESMTRTEFLDQLQKPFFRKLESEKLLQFGSAEKASGDNPEKKLVDAKIRYVVLCYGVPLKIARDTSLKEETPENLPSELRRNEASVEADLAISVRRDQKINWQGPIPNIFYQITNVTSLHATNGILMVARLDGPSKDVAMGLVDKAMQAEEDGLWGRGYFDCRGLTNTNYKLGDEWIRNAYEYCRRLGFESTLDERPETFSVGYPMSHIAFYAGWYDGSVSGPFTRPKVEFMPGALAYHLHSFSAVTIRSTNQNWVGPLLAKGATVTMGCVEEPYLEGTPDVGTWFAMMLYGASFGEAAYASQRWLSWQTTVVGDPLYRPFNRPPQQLHLELVNRRSPLVEWSHLRVVNLLNAANNATPGQLVDYLLNEPLAKTSSILTEKLADLYNQQGKIFDAQDTYARLLKMVMSPQQRIRITLTAAKLLALRSSREAEAYGIYQQFLKDNPDYPDLASVYARIVPLARSLQKKDELEKYQKELDRLTTPAPKSQ